MNRRVAATGKHQDIGPGLVRPARLHRACGLGLRQVDRAVVPGEVTRLVADVARAQAEVAHQLAFEREVPLLRKAVLDLALDDRDRRVGSDRARTRKWVCKRQAWGCPRGGLEGLREEKRR